MDVFPPCARNTQDFTIKYFVNGPMCLLATGCTFTYITLDDWRKVDPFEKKAAIIIVIILYLSWFIIVPVFVLLEMVKFALYPFGLAVYILTKKYYQTYPPDRPSSRSTTVRESYVYSTSQNIAEEEKGNSKSNLSECTLRPETSTSEINICVSDSEHQTHNV